MTKKKAEKSEKPEKPKVESEVETQIGVVATVGLIVLYGYSPIDKHGVRPAVITRVGIPDTVVDLVVFLSGEDSPSSDASFRVYEVAYGTGPGQWREVE